MITLNNTNSKINKIKSCNIPASNPFGCQKFANLAPLKSDVLSFTSKKTIAFNDVDFKNKFNTDDYKTICEISTFAQKTGTKIYLVGGIVRDMLLGQTASDIDFLIEGDAIEFTKKFNEQHPETQIEYLKHNFGTAKLRINGSDIDLASTREESYIRKAIPNVKNIGCSMQKDIKRRDFTINSMALQLKIDKNNNVKFIPVDIAGGLNDLNNGIIRATYQDSFNDDPTRILRGLKFRLRYGFKYDDKTKEMQEKYLINPPREEISASRIDITLRKLFQNKDMAPEAFNAVIKERLYLLFTPEILAGEWGYRIQHACEIFEINDIVNVYMKLLDNAVVSKAQEIFNSQDDATNYDIYIG